MHYRSWRIGALGAALVVGGIACSDDDADQEIDEIEQEVDTAVDNIEDQLDTIVDEAEDELDDVDLDPGDGTGLPGDDGDEAPSTTEG